MRADGGGEKSRRRELFFRPRNLPRKVRPFAHLPRCDVDVFFLLVGDHREYEPNPSSLSLSPSGLNPLLTLSLSGQIPDGSCSESLMAGVSELAS